MSFYELVEVRSSRIDRASPGTAMSFSKMSTGSILLEDFIDQFIGQRENWRRIKSHSQDRPEVKFRTARIRLNHRGVIIRAESSRRMKVWLSQAACTSRRVYEWTRVSMSTKHTSRKPETSNASQDEPPVRANRFHRLFRRTRGPVTLYQEGIYSNAQRDRSRILRKLATDGAFAAKWLAKVPVSSAPSERKSIVREVLSSETFPPVGSEPYSRRAWRDDDELDDDEEDEFRHSMHFPMFCATHLHVIGVC